MLPGKVWGASCAAIWLQRVLRYFLRSAIGWQSGKYSSKLAFFWVVVYYSPEIGKRSKKINQHFWFQMGGDKHIVVYAKIETWFTTLIDLTVTFTCTKFVGCTLMHLPLHKNKPCPAPATETQHFQQPRRLPSKSCLVDEYIFVRGGPKSDKF